MVQQPINVQPASQVLSVRTANGQIVQVPNSQQAQVVQAPPQTSTVHIPGLGPVQIMNAIQLPAGNGTAVNGAQIVNAVPAGSAATPAGTTQFTTAQPVNQQALQPDPNDSTKWQVVQVANSAIPMQQAPQTAQIVTANGTVLGSATIPAGTTTLPTTAEVNVSHVDTNAGATNSNNIQTTSNGGQPTKTRLRRVACTCPNCKDGDRSRGK